MSTAIITSWLLTYLAHSTVLLGAALITVGFLGERHIALQEILLRAALIGGLLTATLQLGLGVEPAGGAFALPHLSVTENTVSEEVASTVVHTDAIEMPPGSTPWTRVEAIGPIALLSLWGAGALVALTGLGRSILDLRRLLKTRRFRPTGRLFDRLAAAMGLRRPVRLSTSAAIAVPFAIGIRQPEICCPERVGELAVEHQRGLYAHELAHLARHDPTWQLLYRLGEAMLFVQPLNRLVRRRLEQIAEHLTDERAVACTGDRLGLARSLVVVAHWGVSKPPGLPATAFAAGPRLDRRVRHLLYGAVENSRPSRWAAPGLAVALAMAVLLLPAFAPPAVHADTAASGSDAPRVQPRSPKISLVDESPVPEPPPVEPPLPDRAMPEPAPASGAVPQAPVEPRPVSTSAAPPQPAALLESAPPAVPVPSVKTVPAPTPHAPATLPKTAEPTPVKPDRIPDERSREAAREHQRAEHRERANAEARARQRAREVDAEARDLEREAAERSRFTAAEREALRNEARERVRRAEREARELEQRAGERSRITDAEREKLRRRAETLRATQIERSREASREAREQAQALVERARRLAEEAEAERRAAEKRE
jgi:beta-lactamase regulating signal transducer with metallopeptidase domain